MRVARKDSESATVTSLTLVPVDGKPLETPLPGQFLLLRLNAAGNAPALLRSYSLSGPQSQDSYRVSVKRLPQGRAGTFIETRLAVGDHLDASAPRGSFTLVTSQRPIVFLSAGIGATPLLAMLHAVAAARLRTKSGGSTAPRMAASIPSPVRSKRSWHDCPGATGISATAHPVLRTGPRSIFTRKGA